MINTSAAFKERIVGDTRKTKIKAVMDIVDPDLQYGAVTGVTQTAYSEPAQLYDGITELQPYATLETNRWVLDGTFDVAHAGMTQEIAWESSVRSDSGGAFSSCYFSLAISNITVLQALTVFWPTAAYDGYPVEFTVEVRQGGTAYFTKTVTGNTDTKCVFKNFVVYNPDEIYISISEWSVGDRRARCPEILPGIHEEWSGDDFAEFSVRQQSDFSCVSLPYGTATLSIDNSTREFDPRSKTGLMQSIEERQGIVLSIGVEGAEYVPVGTFFQYANGWKTSNYDLTMTWSLVDIVGLLVDRQYEVPNPLPTTLGGWVASIVGQLGTKLENFYHVDPNYESVSLTVGSAADVTDKTCGQILLWICQASGTWPRADAETGKLAIEPFWNQGNAITLDNLAQYPTLSANKDLAFIKFTLPDSTVVTVSGTSSSSPNTLEITNPFIHDNAAALVAAREIISVYGGSLITTTGRGDPSSEIGDVPTVQVDKSNAMTGRMYYQDFIFQDGVMTGCTSQMLQANGSELYSKMDIYNADGTWTAPMGVTEARIILVGGGYGGAPGYPGALNQAGAQGAPGVGGKVFYTTTSVTPGSSYAISVGAGGTYPYDPGDTTFGAYSSANGHTYEPSYTDVQSGSAYGRTGVATPTGNGDGGAGGAGGLPGSGYTQTTTTTKYILYPDVGEPFEIPEIVYNELCSLSPTGNPDDYINGHVEVETKTTTQFIYTTYPTNGSAGVTGGNGCAIIYYNA